MDSYMVDAGKGRARIPKVFLCHSSSDKNAVRELHQRLRSEGFDPWLDEDRLLPGHDWSQEIVKAVRNSDVVIVCLSRRSITKQGYVQKEIRQALDVAEERPEGAIFIIPLRLEDCEVPERLRRWQWVNLFEASGYDSLKRAIEAQAGTKRVKRVRAARPLPDQSDGEKRVDASPGLASVSRRTIRIAIRSSPPFSGSRYDFFDQLFGRFSRLNLGTDVMSCHTPDISTALAEAKVDLVFPLLCGVDRSIQLHSWATPIRLGLGAVIHADHISERDWIKKVLSLGARKSNRMRPIVVQGDVGAVHCLETLGFGEDEVICVDRLDPALLALQLRQTKLTTEGIPVVVVDEHTSFEVLRRLGNEGRPVIPLSSRAASRSDFARRELPQRFLGFSCNRQQTELRDLIEQSFHLFLATEQEAIASAMADLYSELMKELEDVVRFYLDCDPASVAAERDLRFQLARNWILYTLALERESIENYPHFGMPWRPILERARQTDSDRFG
jgi:hypothetical protein